MTENTNKKTGTGALAAIVVLAIALIGLSIFTYSQYSENKQTKMDLNSERDSLIVSLEEQKTFYDKKLSESDSLNTDIKQQLEMARSEVSLYIDSLKTTKISLYSLRKYKQRALDLEKERDLLMARIDSLQMENKYITMQRDSLDTALGEQIIITDSVVVQNTKLTQKVEIGSMLSLSKLNVDAVKVKGSGKMVSTPKAKRADRIKVCFTVSPNKIAASEDKTLYVQVIGPGDKIMGSSQAMVDGKTPITYTKTSTFFYENDALDVCEYIQKPGDEFAEGKYKITLYDAKLNELGTTDFTLK